MTANTDSPPASPEALLKAAVSGGRPVLAPSPAEAPSPAAAPGRRVDARAMGLAGIGLVLGTMLGAGGAILAMPRTDGSNLALGEINAGIEAGRLETARIAVASDRLDRAIAALSAAAAAAQGDAKAAHAAMVAKVGGLEGALVAKVAALGERIERAETEQGARVAALAAQADRRTAAPVPTPPKVEPVQTGSIADARTKPAPEKPSVIEAWAVRDVYDGTAMLEDRRRRLVEVSAGETIPGIGRVESIERRGNAWVVVTRQGIVTPQTW